MIALAANNPFLVYSSLRDIREDPNFALESLVPEPPNPDYCGPISTVSALSSICQIERFGSKRDWILGLKDFSRLLEKKLGKYGFDAQYNFCIRLSASSWTRGISKNIH